MSAYCERWFSKWPLNSGASEREIRRSFRADVRRRQAWHAGRREVWRCVEHPWAVMADGERVMVSVILQAVEDLVFSVALPSVTSYSRHKEKYRIILARQLQRHRHAAERYFRSGEFTDHAVWLGIEPAVFIDTFYGHLHRAAKLTTRQCLKLERRTYELRFTKRQRGRLPKPPARTRDMHNWIIERWINQQLGLNP